METKIYVIINTYTDAYGSAIATDGGAYTNENTAKMKLYDYVNNIFGDILDKETIDSCFETDRIWVYEGGDGDVSSIEICDYKLSNE